MKRRISRRAFVAASPLALGLVPALARAMGRTPIGGRLAMELPWPTSSIDPHELRDPTAALFAGAVFDSLFALDGSGAPYPTLAAALPSREGAATIVRLREGLRTARGAPLAAADVIASIERARARGASALLVDVARAAGVAGDRLAVSFGATDPGRLARALASPLCALVPRSFTPTAPDGTGAFRADASAQRLLLTRNPNAARGSAFLDAVEVRRTDDLKGSLRAFEAERADVGWLGLGLHEPRRGAQRFDFGSAAWIVLATGADAQSFGMPGVAQRLADAIPPDRVAYLGLGPLPAASGDAGWGGPTTDLLVEDAPQLVEIARAIAPILSRPGHELTVLPLPRAELARRRARDAALAIDVVRPLGPGLSNALLALAMADDPARARDLAKHPAQFASTASPRNVTSTLRVGVLGELRVSGGVVPDVVLARSAYGDGWDLGWSYRKPSNGVAIKR